MPMLLSKFASQLRHKPLRGLIRSGGFGFGSDRGLNIRSGVSTYADRSGKLKVTTVPLTSARPFLIISRYFFSNCICGGLTSSPKINVNNLASTSISVGALEGVTQYPSTLPSFTLQTAA